MHYPQSTLTIRTVLHYCAKPCRNTELASAVELPSFEMRAAPKGELGQADTTLDPAVPHSPRWHSNRLSHALNPTHSHSPNRVQKWTCGHEIVAKTINVNGLNVWSHLPKYSLSSKYVYLTFIVLKRKLAVGFSQGGSAVKRCPRSRARDVSRPRRPRCLRLPPGTGSAESSGCAKSLYEAAAQR